jgi:inner membrane protein
LINGELDMRTGGWLGKVVILAAVTLLLCAVLARIGWLADERQDRQREAVASVEQSQAGAQVLLGPLLLRHCTEEWDAVSGDGKDRKIVTDKRDFVLSAVPSSLGVSGALNREPRYRGLFKVNGYAGALQFDARWNSLENLQARAEHAGGRLQCDDPQAMLATSDARGLRMAEVTAGAQSLVVKPGTLLPS